MEEMSNNKNLSALFFIFFLFFVGCNISLQAQSCDKRDIPQINWEDVDVDIESHLTNLLDDLNGFAFDSKTEYKPLLRYFLQKDDAFVQSGYNHPCAKMECVFKGNGQKLSMDVDKGFRQVSEFISTYYEDWEYSFFIRRVEVIVYCHYEELDCDVVYIKAAKQVDEDEFQIGQDVRMKIVPRKKDLADVHLPKMSIEFGNIDLNLMDN